MAPPKKKYLGGVGFQSHPCEVPDILEAPKPRNIKSTLSAGNSLINLVRRRLVN